ncbi:sorting nexin-8 isoform X3 [Zootoca vivipara]|uniref:sorting nexin-8 isoform X3 n=1 Tax=Zootoca vivipara TaxID=8524 RepID=UPI00293BDA9A|nr:sorting nexin-8 isoform X3 [Zootoca vivipara]
MLCCSRTCDCDTCAGQEAGLLPPAPASFSVRSTVSRGVLRGAAVDRAPCCSRFQDPLDAHLTSCTSERRLGKSETDSAKPPSDLQEPEESQGMQTSQGNPLVLPHTLPELLSKDTVQVELIPEKKGLFLKHVEYEVSSKDVQNKLRELVQGVGDEFMTCKLATQAKDFLPPDIQVQFAASRELIRNIYNSFYKLRDRTEKIASRAIDNASDLLLFGKELSALGSDTTPLPSWASLNNSAWGNLKQALKGLSVEFALLADKAVQQGKQEENDVVEKLNLFLDLLQSYKDLCERHEKGVLHKHQRALHKYSAMKRQMMSATVQNKEPESVEQLESRIVEQENTILTMELRNYFSLYCLHQETQLIHIYLPLTSHILGAFVNSQIQGHKEMSKVWNELKPKLSCLFSGSRNMSALPLSSQEVNFFPS